MENKKWIIICIIGGILMLISSVVRNVSFFALIFGIASDILGPESSAMFSLVLQLFSYMVLGGNCSNHWSVDCCLKSVFYREIHY